jgi:hypothetical protein
MGKLLSLVLSAAYLVAALASGDVEVIFSVLGFVLLSLACIWFGDEIGDYTGWIELRPITARTPGGMVRFVGWLLLLLPAVAFGIQQLRT